MARNNLAAQVAPARLKKLEDLRRGHVVGTETARDVYECPKCRCEFAILRHSGERQVHSCPKCGWDGALICHTKAEAEKVSDGMKIIETTKGPFKRLTLSEKVAAEYGVPMQATRDPEKGVREDGSYTVRLELNGKFATLSETLTPDGLTDTVEAEVSDGAVEVPGFDSFRDAEEWVVDWLKGK